MPDEIIVNVDGHNWPIRKMPLGKYAELLLALKELPKHLDGIDEFSNDEIIQRLPSMIATSLPELAKIISIATDIPEDKVVNNTSMGELTDIVIAVLDVNDIEKVIENVKKIVARKAFQGMKKPKLPKTA